MLQTGQTARVVGMAMAVALALAPLSLAMAQEGTGTDASSPEWGEESLAPGASTETTEIEVPQQESSPEAGGASNAELAADQPLDPAALPAEADAASLEAVEHPADTGDPNAPEAPVAGESLFLPNLSSGENSDGEAASVGEVDEIDESAGSNEANAIAAAPSSRTASGDFDGNGVRDLAIGVPSEDIFVGGINRTNAGAVHIFYGNSEAGLTTTPARVTFWHQDIAGVPGIVETGDLFGSAIVAGRFNADGFDDLAIGVPGEDDVAANEGFIHVLYGSANGLTTANTFFSGQLGAEKEVGDSFGSALATGNFNGDARDDLAIGIPNEDVGATSDAGSVQIFFGSAAGTGGLNTAGSQIFRQGTAGILDGLAANDRFGTTLTAARFNDGIFVDLAVGVPLENIGVVADAGAVHVIYGAAAGLSAAGNQFWHQDVGGVPGVVEASDQFGFSLAAGDYDNDNRADLTIGVPLEDFAFVNDGVVHVLYGAAASLNTVGTQLLSQNFAGILDVSDAGDQFGYSLAAGNFNCDVRADLAIGVPFEDVVATNDGLVHEILGIDANGLGAAGNRTWFQSKFGILDLSENGDLFGLSLSTGDFDANCAADLSIGVPLEDLGAAVNKQNAGAANVIYGVPTIGLTTVGDQLWHQDICDAAGCVPDVAEANDRFADAQ